MAHINLEIIVQSTRVVFNKHKGIKVIAQRGHHVNWTLRNSEKRVKNQWKALHSLHSAAINTSKGGDQTYSQHSNSKPFFTISSVL